MSWSIIVGNGFTIDAYNQSNTSFDPNYPWNWPLESPYNENEPLIELFPHLKQHLEDQAPYKDLNVYESLESVVKVTRNRPIQQTGREPTEEDNIHIQACHYLRLAYAWYSNLYSSEDLTSWRWFKWFNNNKRDIYTVLSYNYDLLLEKILRLVSLGIVYGNSSVVPVHEIMMFQKTPKPYKDLSPNDIKLIHIAKPHGSCNFTGWARFEHSKNDEVKPIYPQEAGYIFRDDSYLKVLDEDLYQPTYSADLVVPGEWSWWNEVSGTRLRWVRFQKKTFAEESNQADKLLVTGFGYSEPDRDEFRNLISQINNFNVVHVVDPKPNEELLELLSDITNELIVSHPDDFLNGT